MVIGANDDFDVRKSVLRSVSYTKVPAARNVRVGQIRTDTGQQVVCASLCKASGGDAASMEQIMTRCRTGLPADLTANGGYRTGEQQQLPNARKDDLFRQPCWPKHNGSLQRDLVPLKREKEQEA